MKRSNCCGDIDRNNPEKAFSSMQHLSIACSINQNARGTKAAEYGGTFPLTSQERGAFSIFWRESRQLRRPHLTEWLNATS